MFAWWWDGSYRPTDVPYTVRHAGGSSVVRVNQQTGGGQWNSLGKYTFQETGSVSLSDAVSSGRDIVADAIRLVYAGPAAEPTVAAPNATPTPAPTTVAKPRPTRHPRYAVWLSLLAWSGPSLSADASGAALGADLWMDTADASVSNVSLEFVLPEGATGQLLVQPGAFADGFAVTQVESAPGIVVVSFVRDEPIQGAGQLATVAFAPDGELAKGATLRVTEVVANDGATEVVIDPALVGGLRLYVPTLRRAR